MRLRFLCILAGIALLAAPLALAQTTGSVSGIVRDTNGAPLPGATVSISGPQMPLPRTVTTRVDGAFSFASLIPGTYQLKAELQGLGTFAQDVVVSLAKDTEVRPVLRATAAESVEVTAALPLVDTKSTEVSQVTTRATLEKLPLERTFSGTFQLAPGVVDSGVAISNTNVGINAGGGRQDNTFLYDGVNVTNPFFGDLYQDFAELDIQEVNITRAGVSPEYGRTGGFVVNGVTKSGTNNFHGDLRVEFQASSFVADSKDPNLQTKTERFRPGVDAGGPLVKDHLFGYGSLNYYRANQTDRINSTGDLPDSVLAIKEYFAKLTANPISSILLEGSFRYRDINETNADINLDAASTADIPFEIDRVGVLSAFWSVTPSFNLEAKFNHNDYPSGAAPVIPIGFQGPFDPINPANTGYWCPPGSQACFGVNPLLVNNNAFRRDEYRLTGTYLSHFGGASHEAKLGIYYSDNKEDKLTVSNGWGSIVRTTTSNCLLDADGNDDPTRSSPCYRARYNPIQPAQISRGRTLGIFAQDQATWNRLTLNIGVLLNQDKFIPNDDGTFTFVQGDFHVPNSILNGEHGACSDPEHDPAGCTFQDTYTFPFSKQIQPRVGLAYEVDAKAHDKVYVNYARYDNMDNQSFARAAAPVRLVRTDTYFDIATGAQGVSVTRSNNTGKIVLGNIDPTYTDEFAFGYARPLGGGWEAEISGIWRETKDIIEDFGANDVDNQVDGPSDFRYGNIPGFRKYKALTFQARKAYGDNWTLDVSYTLSRLTGNWDLDYASQLFYSSSYIEDGPFLTVESPNRKGTLIGNRTHVGKVFATYHLPTNTNIGGFLRVQSGRPWEARGIDPVYATDYLYLEKAGSRTLPTWTNFDLSLSQDIPLGPATVRVEARVLNLFNSQPPLTVDQDLCTDVCTSLPITDPDLINPNFGRPTSYATPRRFFVSALVSF
jgi:hypothetical protein